MTKRQQPKRKRLKRWMRRIGVASLVVATVAVIAWHAFRQHLIDTDRFAAPTSSLTVTDRHGTPLRHVRVDDLHRRWVGLDDVSPVFLEAMLAAEDSRFFEHSGVDAQATARADNQGRSA